MDEFVGIVYVESFDGGVLMKYIPAGLHCKFPVAVMGKEILYYKDLPWKIGKTNVNSRFLHVLGDPHEDWPTNVENLYDFKNK